MLIHHRRPPPYDYQTRCGLTAITPHTHKLRATACRACFRTITPGLDDYIRSTLLQNTDLCLGARPTTRRKGTPP